MRGESRNFNQEGRTGRLLDEAYCQTGEDIRQIVGRFVTIVDDFAILVEVIVKFTITVSSHRPHCPARGDWMHLRLIAVQVLAEHCCTIAGRRERGGEGRLLVTAGAKPAVTTVLTDIPVNARIVWIASG